MSNVDATTKHCMNAFNAFMQSPHRFQRINTPEVSMYVRKSARYLEDELCAGVDLANISINPRYRRMGLFSAIREQLEKYVTSNPSTDYLFVECVLVHYLELHLENNGYTSNSVTPGPSFYKVLTHNTRID